MCRKKFWFEVRKVSEIWLKLVQQRTKNSKGVRTRGLRLDFNEIWNLIMIQVWKRKWEPTPGLSKQTSLTGNACFPFPQLNTSTYFYLFLTCFRVSWVSLKRCFLTSVKPLVVKDWNYTYDVSYNYRASNFHFCLIPTPKRSVQKSFSKGLNWPAKVC